MAKWCLKVLSFAEFLKVHVLLRRRVGVGVVLHRAWGGCVPERLMTARTSIGVFLVFILTVLYLYEKWRATNFNT
jgi:hypothetical protein